MSDSVKPIDPGAEFSKPRGEKLPWLIGFIERTPACTLAGGEGMILLNRIRELEKQLQDHCWCGHQLGRCNAAFIVHNDEVGPDDTYHFTG